MLWASQQHSAARRTSVERFTIEKKRESFRWKERVKGGTRERRDGGAQRSTATVSARGEWIGSRDLVEGMIEATVGILGVWLEVSSLSLHYVETREVLPRTSEKDGMRVRFVTLYRANFGTALENFSLAVFRGKLGEFPT